ncbi:MAG: hypothetical protein K2K80_01735 [Clostridia bacterium]|nr:hypothetical protein [Clostridia bacterium]
MPDYFSHYICAEKIFERLDAQTKNKIPSRTLYLLGAQGGDIFFTYNMKTSATNIGRTIHNMNAASVFEILALGNPSYAAGFATHYALDCMLHPAVYAFEKQVRSPLAHQKIESDMGLYISKFYSTRRSILPRENVLACTGPIYDSVKPLFPIITVTGVERCLKRHFNYTRYLYRTKKQSYKYALDFTTLAGAVEDAVSLGIEAVKSVISGNIDGAIFEKSFLQK